MHSVIWLCCAHIWFVREQGRITSIVLLSLIWRYLLCSVVTFKLFVDFFSSICWWLVVVWFPSSTRSALSEVRVRCYLVGAILNLVRCFFLIREVLQLYVVFIVLCFPLTPWGKHREHLIYFSLLVVSSISRFEIPMFHLSLC